MLQEAVLVKKDIVKIILTAVLMLLLVNCFDRPEKSKKSSSYKNEESEVFVNVNIKMTKKWKIKMYIFQDLFLRLCFYKGTFFFQTI